MCKGITLLKWVGARPFSSFLGSEWSLGLLVGEEILTFIVVEGLLSSLTSDVGLVV
jgi:hypothetical protein